MTVRMVVQLSIESENLGQFKKFVTDITTMARTREQGRTLSYDFFSTTPGSLDFLLHEMYVDVDAFVAHMGNLGEHMAVAQKIFKIERMIVSGKLPSALVQQLKSMGASTFVYSEPVSQLAG